MAKRDNSNPEIMRGKDKLGITLLSTNNAIAAIFMSTMFMSFMTDYAGLGAWGATLATVLLLVARFIDAFDDPVQSMIMDNAKPKKNGKYKPFFMLSIIMTTIGVAALYGLPSGITVKPALVAVWVIFFYFVYDIGTSFFNVNLMARTMTNDPGERGKLIVGPRIWTMILSMIGSAFTAVAVSLYEVTGSYNVAFMILATIAAAAAAILSVIGWFMVKERHIVEPEEDAKVSFKDFFELIKENKAMLVCFCKDIFGGFIWTMLFAAPMYYIKWGLCCDLSTGEVDMSLYATYGIYASMMMILPILLATIVATPLLTKVFKNDPARMQRFDYIMQGVGGLIIAAAHFTGLVFKMPLLFFVGLFVTAFFVGLDFVPASAVGMEVMDYTIYKTGKDRSAMTGVLGNFLSKAQNALSSTIVGAVLIAVGYNVDSVTGDYVGELSQIPTMLDGMAVLTGVVPAVLAIIATLIMVKYPINAQVREDMRVALAEKETTVE